MMRARRGRVCGGGRARPTRPARRRTSCSRARGSGAPSLAPANAATTLIRKGAVSRIVIMLRSLAGGRRRYRNHPHFCVRVLSFCVFLSSACCAEAAAVTGAIPSHPVVRRGGGPASASTPSASRARSSRASRTSSPTVSPPPSRRARPPRTVSQRICALRPPGGQCACTLELKRCVLLRDHVDIVFYNSSITAAVGRFAERPPSLCVCAQLDCSGSPLQTRSFLWRKLRICALK